jgi:cell division protein FtsL
MIRRVPSKHRNARVTRETDKEAIMRLGLLLIVGLGLACGFVYAGRQHFAALKYGYATEHLRGERDQLAEQQRRLILAREEAATPLRLEQAAKRLGMQPLQAAQIDPLRQPANQSKKEEVAPRSKQTPAKEIAKPNTKIITKVDTRMPVKPSRHKPI